MEYWGMSNENDVAGRGISNKEQGMSNHCCPVKIEITR
jgi:hypothetical protein